MSKERIAAGDALVAVEDLFNVTGRHISYHDKKVILTSFRRSYEQLRVDLKDQNPGNFLRVLQEYVPQVSHFADMVKSKQLLENDEAILDMLGQLYAAILGSIDWYISLNYRYHINDPNLEKEFLPVYAALKTQLDRLGRGPLITQVTKHAKRYARFNSSLHVNQRKFLADVTKLFI